MNPYALVYPMFAMVLLTFGVLVALFRTRARAVGAGEVSAGYFKVYQGEGETELGAKLSRHFTNLFEAQSLFYVGCVAAMLTGQVTSLVLGLAWAYVALRAVHAYVHTGRNQLQPRIAVYFTSWAVLLALWTAIVAGVASA